MVGRELGEDFPPKTADIGDICLEIEHFSNKKLSDVSLKLHKNEILGIGGLMGAGRTELARAIFGADAIDSGTIKINGEKVSINSPSDAFNLKLAMLPEDRKNQGVFLTLPIRDNVTIPILSKICKLGIVNKKTESSICEKLKTGL